VVATITPSSCVDLLTFRIVGDNCDIHHAEVKSTDGIQARSGPPLVQHICCEGSCTRIALAPDKPTTASVATLPLDTFLPNVEDCVALHNGIHNLGGTSAHQIPSMVQMLQVCCTWTHSSWVHQSWHKSQK